MTMTIEERAAVDRAMRDFLRKRRPPEDLRAEVDLTFRIDGQSVVVYERRVAWPMADGTMIDIDIAKATFVRSRNTWRVYWKRADLRWHRYDPAPDAATVDEFLDIVDEDAFCCFFG